MSRRNPLQTLLCFALVILLTTPAVAGAAKPRSSSDDRASSRTVLLVGLHDDPHVDRGDTWHGARVLVSNPRIDLVVVLTDDPDAFRAEAKQDPRVRYLEGDDDATFRPHGTSDDPHASDQWGLAPAPGMDAQGAWTTTGGSTSVTVAVLDTGIQRDHEDIGNTLQGYDFFNGDATPEDDCGHGTHVAGTVGALRGNGKGVAGTAEVTIMPVKVLGKDSSTGSCTGSASTLANGITYAADHGADVITMSLGCKKGCTSTTVNDAIAYARDRGVLIVSSAGNYGPCTDCVGYPAHHPDVVAVSALDEDGSLASYSSQGPEIDLAAPGSRILSTYTGNTYRTMSGTSMAAPHVAGAAALVLSVQDMTRTELRSHLRATAHDGGLPSSEQGAGLLDARSAVEGATATPNEAPTAAFTWSCQDLACTLDGTGSTDADGTMASYAWTLGDGTTATGATPSHTYSAAGTYTVELTVTDDDGATHTVAQDVTVDAPTTSSETLLSEGFEGTLTGWRKSGSSTDLWRVATDCVAAAEGTRFAAFNRGSPRCDYDVGHARGWVRTPSVDAAGRDDLTLTFQHRWDTEDSAQAVDVLRVQVSSDGGSTWTTLRSWDSTTPEPAGWTTESLDLSSYASGQLLVRWTFDTQDGSYNDHAGWFVDDVQLTAGSTTSTSEPAPEPNQAPTAHVTAGCTDLACRFDATGSADGDGTITSYDWTLGDGTTATGSTPSHTYAQAGTYTVEVTVTDDAGATDTATTQVTVTAPNQAPTADVQASCTDLACTLDATGSSDPDGSIASYAWDLGDGATATGSTVEHAYAADGTYTVTLTVTDDAGATHTTTRDVTVTALAQEEPTTSTLLHEDFEDAPTGWTKSSSSTDLWRLADDCVEPAQGQRFAAFNRGSPDCDYEVGRARGWLSTPTVDASGTSAVSLTFQHRWDIEDDPEGYDRFGVQVSSDGGSTWTTLRVWDSSDPEPSGWVPVEVDLTSFAGSDLRVRWIFDTLDGSYNDHAGWFVDDVRIQTG